jgi:hypothetical protein
VDGSSILAENIVETSGVVGSLVLMDHATSIAITNANILWTAKPDSTFLPDNNQYLFNNGFTSITPRVTGNMHSVDLGSLFSKSTGKFVVYVEYAKNAPEKSVLPLSPGNSTSEAIKASMKQDEKSKVDLSIVATAAAAFVGSGLILGLLAMLFIKSIKKQRYGEM